MSAPVLPRYQSGGTLRTGSLYVERPADQELPKALIEGEFCYILAPRQIGKSSLRARTARHLQQQGLRCATIDLTSIGASNVTPEQWYSSLITELSTSLELVDPNAFWSQQEQLTPVHRFSRFLREVVLNQIDQPIVIFIDEIDATRTLPFSADDFFAAIRAVYNARSDDTAYRRLTFCLIGLAAPSELVQDERKTPFNIGRAIRMEDFTREEAQAFEPGLAAAGGDPRLLLEAVLEWTDGHPYMTQRVCEALVLEEGGGSERERADALVDTLFLQRGRTEDLSLAYAEKRFVAQDPDRPDPLIRRMLLLYRRLLTGDAVQVNNSDEVQLKLRLTGMAAERRDGNRSYLRVRNRIFATVFNLDWVREHEPATLLKEPVARWLEAGRIDDYVLRGAALTEALAWAEGRNDVTADELDFLIAGKAVAEREAVERERQKRVQTVARIQRRALLIVTIVAAILLASLAYNLWQGYKAARFGRTVTALKKAANDAERRKAAAEQSVTGLLGQQKIQQDKYQTITRENRTLARQTQTLEKQKDALTHNKETLQTKNNTLSQNNQALIATGKTLSKHIHTLREQSFLEQSALNGFQAVRLAQQPGHEVQALALAKTVAKPFLFRSGTVPTEVTQGLFGAAFAARYSWPLQHSKIHSAAFSPDDAHILTAGDNGTVFVWDILTKQHTAVLTGANSAKYSPDGKYIVTYGKSKIARIYDAKCYKLLHELKGHRGNIEIAEFAPDSKYIVTGSDDNTARKYNLDDGQFIVAYQASQSIHHIAFSGDARLMATGCQDGNVQLWNMSNNNRQFEYETGYWEVNDLALSNDGNRLLVVAGSCTAQLVDTKNGKLINLSFARITGLPLLDNADFAAW